jgi:hypothetical protein
VAETARAVASWYCSSNCVTSVLPLHQLQPLLLLMQGYLRLMFVTLVLLALRKVDGSECAFANALRAQPPAGLCNLVLGTEVVSP